MSPTFRQLLLTSLLAILLLVVLIYGIYRVYPRLVGPKIEVYLPTDGDTVHEDTFVVTGKVTRVKKIKIQGREITIDQEGIFTERLVSHAPYTILVIEAVDRYNKEVQKVLYIQKGKKEK